MSNKNKIYAYYDKPNAINKLHLLNDDNYHLYSMDKPKCEDGSKYFYLMTFNDIYNRGIQNNSHYYEHYDDQQNIKFFLDLDCERETTRYTNIDDIINDCLGLINPLFAQYNYKNYPIIILDSSRTEKFSVHIVFPTIIFKSVLHIKKFLIYTLKIF